MTKGLELLPKDIQLLVTGASSDARRNAVLAAVRLAVQRSHLDDPRIQNALQLLDAGSLGDSLDRRALEALASELDERAWDLQERAERGDAGPAEYPVAFARARAAAAVWSALDMDTDQATSEALYEASHAIEDPDALRRAIEPFLR